MALRFAILGAGFWARYQLAAWREVTGVPSSSRHDGDVQHGLCQNYLGRECFPQTLAFVEGTTGSVELAPNYWIRTTTAVGTQAIQHPPQLYPWLDPAYAVVQSSIVDCHLDRLRGLADRSYTPETTAADNLKTLRLVFDAYESAAKNQVISY